MDGTRWCLVVMGPNQRDNEMLNLFDAMIMSEEIKTVVRATRNWKYCEKLRSYDITDGSQSSGEWALRHIEPSLCFISHCVVN